MDLSNLINIDSILSMEPEARVVATGNNTQPPIITNLKSNNPESKEVSFIITEAIQHELDNSQYYRDKLGVLPEYISPEVNAIFNEMLNMANKNIGRLQMYLSQVSPEANNIIAGMAEVSNGSIEKQSTPVPSIFEDLDKKSGNTWEITYRDYTKTGNEEVTNKIKSDKSRAEIIKAITKNNPGLEIVSVKLLESAKKSKFVKSYLGESKAKANNHKSLNESFDQNNADTVNSWRFKGVGIINKKITLIKRIEDLVNKFLSCVLDEFKEISIYDRLNTDPQEFKADFEEYVEDSNILLNAKDDCIKDYNQIIELLNELIDFIN